MNIPVTIEDYQAGEKVCSICKGKKAGIKLVIHLAFTKGLEFYICNQCLAERLKRFIE